MGPGTRAGLRFQALAPNSEAFRVSIISDSAMNLKYNPNRRPPACRPGPAAATERARAAAIVSPGRWPRAAAHDSGLQPVFAKIRNRHQAPSQLAGCDSTTASHLMSSGTLPGPCKHMMDVAGVEIY